jgi:hypothetical protein
MYFENFQLIFAIILSILIPLIIYILNSFINEQKTYLNNLGNFSTVQIRSEQGRLFRFNLIKNLSLMKKFIGISILLITIAILLIASFLVYNSKDYFKTYFEAQRNKLNLRTEASVDSLQSIIRYKDNQLQVEKSFSDSLKLVNKNKDEKIILMKKSISKSDYLISIIKTESKTQKK